MPETSVWWKTAVIYQIYPRSFMDSNADGVGDLPGIIAQLDYLQQIGVDAIWLSPIFPSPMADMGYDVANYTDVHHEYGTLADLDRLLAEAHARNIRVILDLVPNHTSVTHPWFIESRSSLDNPRRDWYIWRDPAPNGGPLNNWMSYFHGPAWTFDENTSQYYLHNFDAGQPDLNWRNPEVQEAMFDVIRFWLKRGVDGFRIDVIDRLVKDPDFRDNPSNPRWKTGDNPAWSVTRVYSEMRTAELYTIMRRFREVFEAFDDRVIIGEISYDLDPEGIVPFYGELSSGTLGGDALHLPFNFRLIMLPWDASEIQRYVDQYEAALPDYAWPNYVLGNHDRPRLASRIGQEQARVAAVLLLSLRGTPTLYYGDEIGMENVPIPPDWVHDPQALGPGFNRDECRTPMQWDASANAGFTAADVETWLPVGPNYKDRNVAHELQDPESLLSLYIRLLVYRRQTAALLTGSYRSLEDTPDGCFVFVRENADKELLIALNLTADDKTLAFQPERHGVVVISTNPQRDGLPVDLTAFKLNANEGVIIEVTSRD